MIEVQRDKHSVIESESFRMVSCAVQIMCRMLRFWPQTTTFSGADGFPSRTNLSMITCCLMFVPEGFRFHFADSQKKHQIFMKKS